MRINQTSVSRVRLSKVISTLLMIAVLSGCAPKVKDGHPTDTLRIDVGSEAPTLDPTLAEDSVSHRISYDLFAGLVDFDQQNQVVPGMAGDWDVALDGKTYTFHLLHDLKFSDGSPISASDFVYSWRRLVDPKTASPYNMILNNVVNASNIIAGSAPSDSLGVSAPDANTFVVKLLNADPSFIKAISMSNLAVVPQKIIEKFGNKWTNPSNMVTSGPYMLKEHVVNGYILAQKNPNYYAKSEVNIDFVKYLPYEDKDASIPAYKSGDLDMTWQTVPVDNFAGLQQEYGGQLHVFSQEAIYYYDFNAHNPELAKNPKLRQALSMAIDRETLANNVLRQKQQPLYSTVTTTIEEGRFSDIKYDWSKWPRDQQIAEAKRLYAEAGYSATKPYHFVLTYNTNELHKKTAIAVAAMWKQVLGVDVSLQNQEWKTFLQTRHKGDYEVARDAWVADYDSVISYTNLYQCNNPQNNSHWCDPKYDQLIAQANAEKDVNRQTELYTQALQIPLNDYAIIPLFQYTVQVLVKPYIANLNLENNFLYHVQTKWMSIQ